MTKSELMKLAELTPQQAENLYGHNPMSSMAEGAWMPVGAKAENARLLPLIEALAESNEKLVDVLDELVTLVDDQLSGIYEADSFTTQPARTVLAGHQARMTKLKEQSCAVPRAIPDKVQKDE